MAYWLMKSEPDVFSIDDLARKKKSAWDGVRNYQARNYMRDMQIDDMVLFYHSSCTPPGIAGIARVCKRAYPDHTSWDETSEYFDPKSNPAQPRWFMVDVAFVEKFRELIALDTLRQIPALAEMLVLRRGQRLSVQPVEKADFEFICKLARQA